MSSSSTTTTTSQPYKPLKVTPLPRSLYPEKITYHPSAFTRLDPTPDSNFYNTPRLVQHIDAGAIASLKAYYASIITPSTSSIVDICSSWVSHLPDTLLKGKSVADCKITGYGMNAHELSQNPHLTQYHVRDLNIDPSLKEIETESVDVVICNVSIDYLTKPVEVLGEVKRVLKRGGRAELAFSDRCFATKVIGVWGGLSDLERVRWVGGYFWACGGWRGVEGVVLKEGRRGFFGGGEDPMFVVRGVKV